MRPHPSSQRTCSLTPYAANPSPPGQVPEADYTSMVIMPKPCRVRYIRKKLVV